MIALMTVLGTCEQCYRGKKLNCSSQIILNYCTRDVIISSTNREKRDNHDDTGGFAVYLGAASVMEMEMLAGIETHSFK